MNYHLAQIFTDDYESKCCFCKLNKSCRSHYGLLSPSPLSLSYLYNTKVSKNAWLCRALMIEDSVEVDACASTLTLNC